MLSIASILTALASCRIVSLQCRVNVTKDYVFFDWCYNTLSFNEVEIKDSSEKDYPVTFEKKNAFELLRTDSTKLSTDGLKLFFNKVNRGFAWKYYPKVVGHSQDAYYTEEYQIVPKLNNVFKKNTWYLFNFYNPEFDLLVHCDTAGVLKSIRLPKNTSF